MRLWDEARVEMHLDPSICVDFLVRDWKFSGGQAGGDICKLVSFALYGMFERGAGRSTIRLGWSTSRLQ